MRDRYLLAVRNPDLFRQLALLKFHRNVDRPLFRLVFNLRPIDNLSVLIQLRHIEPDIVEKRVLLRILCHSVGAVLIQRIHIGAVIIVR